MRTNEDFLRMVNSGAFSVGDVFLLKDIDIVIPFHTEILGATFFMKNINITLKDGFGQISNSLMLNLDELTKTDVRNYTRGHGLFLSEIDYLNSLCGKVVTYDNN